jgi:hypothetical protein
MKKTTLYLLTVVLSALVISPSALYGQRGMKWRGSAGWGPGSGYQKMFDQKTVETIKGQVTSVETFTPRRGMSGGVHLNLKTDKETVSVHLGPSWFLENQDVKIEKGDKIEVAGSRLTFNGAPALIATHIKKGSAVLKLRDDDGYPVWAGWRNQ